MTQAAAIVGAALATTVAVAMVVLVPLRIRRRLHDTNLPPEIRRPLQWRSIPFRVDFTIAMAWLAYLLLTEQFESAPVEIVFLGIFGGMAAVRATYLYVLLLINGERLSALPRGWVWTPSGNLACAQRGKYILVEQVRGGVDVGRWVFEVDGRESSMSYPNAEGAVAASLEGVAS